MASWKGEPRQINRAKSGRNQEPCTAGPGSVNNRETAKSPTAGREQMGGHQRTRVDLEDSGIQQGHEPPESRPWTRRETCPSPAALRNPTCREAQRKPRTESSMLLKRRVAPQRPGAGQIPAGEAGTRPKRRSSGNGPPPRDLVVSMEHQPEKRDRRPEAAVSIFSSLAKVIPSKSGWCCRRDNWRRTRTVSLKSAKPWCDGVERANVLEQLADP